MAESEVQQKRITTRSMTRGHQETKSPAEPETRAVLAKQRASRGPDREVKQKTKSRAKPKTRAVLAKQSASRGPDQAVGLT